MLGILNNPRGNDFAPETDRFSMDFAAIDKQNREQQRLRKDQIYTTRRHQKLDREAQHWKNEDAVYNR